MEQTEKPEVSVTVVRTGGVTGIRREWRAQPPASDGPRWIVLIRQCPWEDEDAADAPGVDRFTWHIQAHWGSDDRRVSVPETHLQGPWRELVAEVQAFEQDRGSPHPGR